MISICNRAFDPGGALVVGDSIKHRLDQRERRVSRIKTLDGGYALNDTGEHVADRTLQIELPNDAAALATAKRLVAWGRVTVSVSDGVFVGVASSISQSSQRKTITILVLEKISA